MLVGRFGMGVSGLVERLRVVIVLNKYKIEGKVLSLLNEASTIQN